MSAPTLPLIIEPKDLEPLLGHPDILVVDLCKAENYQKYHIKGAVRLEYSSLVKAEKPLVGILPDVQTLTQVFSDIGISPNKHVILYDDEGNGMACRTGWTLEACGFTRFSILNGGLVAWINEGHGVENRNREPTPATFVAQPTDAPVASKPYILGQLSNPNIRLLDARSPEEYRGEKRLADRAGHIPGAVNLNWVESVDPNGHTRFKSADLIRQKLKAIGVTPDKEIIVYCHSHQRSAHTYMVLRHLGYPKVKGFPGSWSDWGSDPTTPVEC